MIELGVKKLHENAVIPKYQTPGAAFLTFTRWCWTIKQPSSLHAALCRIAQAMLERVGQVRLVEVESLSESERGAGGFGSTGT